MKKIIILAALLYSLLAPFTFHPDTKLTLLYPSLGERKTLNIYQYLEKHPNSWPPFHYPPLNFLLLKFQFGFSKIIGGEGFTDWLSTGANLAPQNKAIFRFDLAAKLPLLILTIITGWIIYLITTRATDEKKGRQAALIWLFNPLTLYAVVLMGQNDILAIFLFLAGLLFYKKKPKVGFLLFGLATAVKIFPLLWVLVAALVYPTKKWIQKIRLFLISFTVYFISLLPFLGSAYFRKNVIFSGLSTRMFASSINIGFQESALIVPALIMFLLLLKPKAGENHLVSLSKKILSLNLIILGFSHFHPQWALWTMPFFAILIATLKEKKNYLLLLSLFTASVFAIIFLYKDTFLQLGILSPLNPNLLNLPSINEILSRKLSLDVNLINNLSHSVIAGLALYSIYLVTVKETFLAGRKDVSKKIIDLLYKKTSRIMITVIFLSALFSLGYLAPTIEKEASVHNPKRIEYLSLKEVKQKTLLTKISRNNLYRIEVLMKNPELKSRDEFEVVISRAGKNKNTSPIIAKQVNAFNIGDPGYIRIDVPREVLKQNDTLAVQIKATGIKDGRLQIGLTQKEGKNVPLVNFFYKPRLSVMQAPKKAAFRLLRKTKRQPGVFLLPLFLSLI